jgi:hypothetical protein
MAKREPGQSIITAQAGSDLGDGVSSVSEKEQLLKDLVGGDAVASHVIEDLAISPGSTGRLLVGTSHRRGHQIW